MRNRYENALEGEALSPDEVRERVGIKKRSRASSKKNRTYGGHVTFTPIRELSFTSNQSAHGRLYPFLMESDEAPLIFDIQNSI